MYVITLYPAKTQNGSSRITDLSKMLMSAFTLKCHKMLPISHFNKTVMNIDYYHYIITTKGPQTDLWIKNLNIEGIKGN